MRVCFLTRFVYPTLVVFPDDCLKHIRIRHVLWRLNLDQLHFPLFYSQFGLSFLSLSVLVLLIWLQFVSWLTVSARVLHTKLMYKKMSFLIFLEKSVTYLGLGNRGGLGTERNSSAVGASMQMWKGNLEANVTEVGLYLNPTYFGSKGLLREK